MKTRILNKEAKQEYLDTLFTLESDLSNGFINDRHFNNATDTLRNAYEV